MTTLTRIWFRVSDYLGWILLVSFAGSVCLTFLNLFFGFPDLLYDPRRSDLNKHVELASMLTMSFAMWLIIRRRFVGLILGVIALIISTVNYPIFGVIMGLLIFFVVFCTPWALVKIELYHKKSITNEGS